MVNKLKKSKIFFQISKKFERRGAFESRNPSLSRMEAANDAST